MRLELQLEEDTEYLRELSQDIIDAIKSGNTGIEAKLIQRENEAKDRAKEVNPQVEAVRREVEQLLAATASAPKRPRPAEEVFDELKRKIATITFPTDLEAYEFPTFNLPVDDLNFEAVRKAVLRCSWSTPTIPDFLLSGLEEKLVELVEISWDEGERSLSLTDQDGLRKVKAPTLKLGARRYVVLAATSGSGKTRCLLEHAYKEYACILFGKSGLGSEDLSTFLEKLPSEPGDVDKAREKFWATITAILAIRAVMLRHLKGLFGKIGEKERFLPKHWLALQLYPSPILGNNYNVFLDIFDRINREEISESTTVGEFWNSGMVFVAIDEAQAVDAVYPDTFTRTAKSTPRCALGPIVDTLVRLNYGVVLSGTRLNIVSAIELLDSGIGKPVGQGVSLDVYGTRTMFNSMQLEKAIRERGFQHGEIDLHAREYFVGRPRFGMNLAVSPLTGQDWQQASKKSIDELHTLVKNLGNKPATDNKDGEKRLLSDITRACRERELKGLGGITSGGDVALEFGVCAVNFADREPLNQWEDVGDEEGSNEENKAFKLRPFRIQEPIVIRALERYLPMPFEEITNEKPGILARCLNITLRYTQNLCDAVDVIASEAVDKSTRGASTFKGPWVAAKPGANMRRGIRVKAGLEPAALDAILANQGLEGLSLLFPSSSFGADLIIVARRESDGKFLLLFLQCKTSFRVSTQSAMNSLLLPYHENLNKKTQKVPPRFVEPLKQLEQILKRRDVCVVFSVFKYPASSTKSTKEVVVDKFQLPRDKGVIPVMKIVFDHRSAEKRLQDLKKGLAVMENAKRSQAHLFYDGGRL